MKKNEELKYSNKEIKLTKKNYVIIIGPIVLSLILVVSIALYVFVFQNESAKLKRYLENSGYSCNNEICSININDENQVINYHTGELSVSNINYNYLVNQSSIIYQANDRELVCTYTGSNYKYYQTIDTSFTNNNSCEVYIEEINKTIVNYQEIMNKADIDVNQLAK